MVVAADAFREGNSFALGRRLVEAAGFRDRVSGVLVDEVAGHVALAVLGARPALVARRPAAFPLFRLGNERKVEKVETDDASANETATYGFLDQVQFGGVGDVVAIVTLDGHADGIVDVVLQVVLLLVEDDPSGDFGDQEQGHGSEKLPEKNSKILSDRIKFFNF